MLEHCVSAALKNAQACFTASALTTLSWELVIKAPALPDSSALLPCKPDSRKGLDKTVERRAHTTV